MRIGIAMLIVSALTHTAAHAEAPNPGADGMRFIETRYHALEDERFLLDAHLRFRVPEGHEVGWRLAFGQYRQAQVAIRDQHIEFGPVWAFSVPRTPRRCHLRLGLEPWATLWTVRRKTASGADAKLRFGADASATIHADIGVVRALRVSPGAGVVVRFARATNDVEASDAQSAVRMWDSNAACPLSLAVWIGQSRRLKIEGAYSIPLRAATYMVDERWAFDVAWAF